MHASRVVTQRTHAMNVANDRLPLIDVLDRVLDKGIVIDYDINVSVVGLRVVEITGNVIVASIDTYTRAMANTPAATEEDRLDTLMSATDAYLRGVNTDPGN